jgi:hypothetical protein
VNIDSNSVEVEDDGTRGAQATAGQRRTESAMNAKKAMMLVGVALILFYVITQPTQAAQAVQGILGWLKDGAEAIITFMKNLFV